VENVARRTAHITRWVGYKTILVVPMLNVIVRFSGIFFLTKGKLSAVD